MVDLRQAPRQIDAEDIVGVACDIWIPAARPDVLREDNVEGSTGAAGAPGRQHSGHTRRRAAHARARHPIDPDFIANAGGVIAAAVEYRGGTEKAAFDAIAEKIAANTRAMLDVGESATHDPARGGDQAGARPHRAGDELAALAGLSTPHEQRIC